MSFERGKRLDQISLINSFSTDDDWSYARSKKTNYSHFKDEFHENCGEKEKKVSGEKDVFDKKSLIIETMKKFKEYNETILKKSEEE